MSNLRVMGQSLDRDKRYEHLQKEVDRVVKVFGYQNVSVTGHSLGTAFAILVAKVFCDTIKCKWTPHLILNKRNFINQRYINQFIDQENCRDGGFKA